MTIEGLAEVPGVLCPACGAAMVLRQRRSDAREFWGCPTYPKCRGTRQIEVAGSGSPGQTASAKPAKSGDAGASAAQEFERRAAKRKARVRAVWPLVVGGGLVGVVAGIALTFVGPTYQLLGWMIAGISVLSTASTLFLMPNTTLAWRRGAEGELRTADLLAKLGPEGFVSIHDRAIPRSRANIDHIVVGPPGVFVVETKRYSGEVRMRHGELTVAGRKHSDWIAEAKRERDAVATVIAPTPVSAIICVHKADLPLRRLEVDGIPILTGRGLLRELRGRPAVLSPEEISCLASEIEPKLPPASRPTPPA